SNFEDKWPNGSGNHKSVDKIMPYSLVIGTTAIPDTHFFGGMPFILRIGQKISEPLPGNKLQGIFRSSIVSLMEVFFSHLRSDFCQPSHPAILPAPQANAVFSWIDRKIIQTSCRRLFSPCLEKQS
ncbi:MAG: hypothetical protein LHW45_10345, partial [Candidatus Cloacimonetes bacterium]|nr:hypothetical protein [Candidatus Cloacimonadota bacterium]MDY0368009.1 hypothetical protein [Candidatus Syntrophosphaera sp.]